MMIRIVPVIVLALATLCLGKVSPTEILKQLDDHVKATYSKATCDFKFFDTRTSDRTMTVHGTLRIDNGNRRIEYKEQTINGATGEKVWISFRYVRINGELYANAVGNGVVSLVPQDQAAVREPVFRRWSPWDVQTIVGGDGRRYLPDLLADQLNELIVVRESENEVVLDVVRGPYRIATYFLDPKNHYVVTKVELKNNETTFCTRTLTYKDGRLILVKNAQNNLDYEQEMFWKGSNATLEELTPESIAGDGDVVIRKDEEGTARAFRVEDGVATVDPSISTEKTETATPVNGMVDGVETVKSTPPVVLSPVDHPNDQGGNIYAVLAGAFAIIACVLGISFFFRKGRV